MPILALPEWWPEEILTSPPTPSPENYTPANLGQLKHMATLAKAHLDEMLVDGAGFLRGADGGELRAG